MKPELPAPQVSPEYQPQHNDTAEHLVDTERTVERVRDDERAVQPAERQTSPPPTAVPLPPQAVSLPALPSTAAQDDTVGPTIANDDDLIEKEWVDKAKKIIVETQNDPYRREKEVNKLQIDYLKKRYGKDLGISN